MSSVGESAGGGMGESMTTGPASAGTNTWSGSEVVYPCALTPRASVAGNRFASVKAPLLSAVTSAGCCRHP